MIDNDSINYVITNHVKVMVEENMYKWKIEYMTLNLFLNEDHVCC